MSQKDRLIESGSFLTLPTMTSSNRSDNIEDYPGLADIIRKLDSKPVREASTDIAGLGFAKRTPIYFLDPTVTEHTRRQVMMMMTLCTRCQDPRHEAWQTFFCTYSLLILPNLYEVFRSKLTTGDYVLERFPDDFISQTRAAIVAQASSETAGDQFVIFPPHLPNASLIPVTKALIAASKTDGLIAHYAMFVFLLGKSNAMDSLPALTINRPRALMQRNQMHASDYLLTGDGKIHPDSYPLIRSGFTRSDAPRLLIVDALAKFASIELPPENFNSLHINVRLLRHTGQTYLYIIRDMVIACPWALSIPSVRLDFWAYSQMVEVIARQPGYLQDFYKFGHQDLDRKVNRRNLDQIIGVATAFASQSRPNMTKYRISESSMPAVKEFFRIAEERGHRFVVLDNQQTTSTDAV